MLEASIRFKGEIENNKYVGSLFVRDYVVSKNDYIGVGRLRAYVVCTSAPIFFEQVKSTFFLVFESKLDKYAPMVIPDLAAPNLSFL